MTGQGSAGLAEALASVREVLESDGFTGEWEEAGGGVVFRVGVGSADCEDCLVPRAVLEMMVGSALEPTGLRLTRLEMPGDR